MPVKVLKQSNQSLTFGEAMHGIESADKARAVRSVKSEAMSNSADSTGIKTLQLAVGMLPLHYSISVSATLPGTLPLGDKVTIFNVELTALEKALGVTFEFAVTHQISHIHVFCNNQAPWHTTSYTPPHPFPLSSTTMEIWQQQHMHHQQLNPYSLFVIIDQLPITLKPPEHLFTMTRKVYGQLFQCCTGHTFLREY
ncbi:hypothetical protein V8B97DRAFT_1919329 [Scleroderma yunnanense]